MLLEVLLASGLAHASVILGAQELADAKAWIPVEGSPPAEAIAKEDETVLKLPCDFSTNENWRVAWDFPLEGDMTAHKRFKLRVRADDPDAVSGVNVYFNSGEGWYTKGMGGVSDEWRTLIAGRSGFAQEREPAGWDKIARIRIAVLPAARRDTAVYVSGLEGAMFLAADDVCRVGPYETLGQIKEAVSEHQAALRHFERGEELLAQAGALADKSSPESQELLVRAREALAGAYLRSLDTRRDEFRGAWFHDGKGPARGWKQAVQDLAANGFNALFPNMLWSGAAFYPSKVVPVAKSAAGKDYLKEILSAARANSVKVHVWKVCWQFGWMADPETAVPFRFAGRMMVDRQGRQGEWLCPSNAENREYELAAIRELVRDYNLDGLHLDYIRYPGDEWCYCSACRMNFEQGIGRRLNDWPAPVLAGGKYENAYREWRRNVITSFVAEVRQEVKGFGRNIQLSAAVFPNPEHARNNVLQDWRRWIKEGLVDFVCPMNYTESVEEMRSRLKSGLAAAGGRVPVYPGLYAAYSEQERQEPDVLAAQIAAARELGAGGFVLFELKDVVLDGTMPLLRLGVTAP